MMPMYGYWHGGVALLVVALAVLLVIGTVVAAVVASTRPGPPAPIGPRLSSAAEETLRLRYARGEIDAAELNERLAALRTTEHRS